MKRESQIKMCTISMHVMFTRNNLAGNWGERMTVYIFCASLVYVAYEERTMEEMEERERQRDDTNTHLNPCIIAVLLHFVFDEMFLIRYHV